MKQLSNLHGHTMRINAESGVQVVCLSGQCALLLHCFVTCRLGSKCQPWEVMKTDGSCHQ